jgi:hypothetical protein
VVPETELVEDERVDVRRRAAAEEPLLGSNRAGTTAEEVS